MGSKGFDFHMAVCGIADGKSVKFFGIFSLSVVHNAIWI